MKSPPFQKYQSATGCHSQQHISECDDGTGEQTGLMSDQHKHNCEILVLFIAVLLK